MNHRSGSKSAGYTLIEMMFVISTMVIGLAIVGPPVAREHQHAQLRRATVQFEAAHSLARSVALEYGRVAALKINASERRFFIVMDTMVALGSSSTTLSPDRVMFGGINRFYTGTMESNRTLLCFNAHGLPTTVGRCEEPDALVVFRLDGLSRSLTYTSLGRLKR